MSVRKNDDIKVNGPGLIGLSDRLFYLAKSAKDHLLEKRVSFFIVRSLKQGAGYI